MNRSVVLLIIDLGLIILNVKLPLSEFFPKGMGCDRPCPHCGTYHCRLGVTVGSLCQHYHEMAAVPAAHPDLYQNQQGLGASPFKECEKKQCSCGARKLIRETGTESSHNVYHAQGKKCFPSLPFN